ncbi:MAG: hypothetical protein ACI4U9_01585 [Clostridia bacterium]
MALKKQIELENGITVNYHRIVTINKVTNNTTVIEVASYINETKRQEEIDALKQGQETGEAVPMNVFIDTTFLHKEYNETDTIKDLYDYLKTTEKFKDAENI